MFLLSSIPDMYRKFFMLLIGAPLAVAAQVPAPSTDASPERDALRRAMAKLVTDEPGFTMPAYREELDSAYSRRDSAGYAALVARHVTTLQAQQAQANWERYTVYTGGGAWIRYVYVERLGSMAAVLERSAQQPSADAKALLGQAREVRKLAFAHALYALAAVKVDGRICLEPVDAPYEALKANLGRALDVAAVLSEPERERLIEYAVTLEKSLAPLREPDKRLCMRGRQTLTLRDESGPGAPARTAPPAPDPARDLIEAPRFTLDPMGAFKPREQWTTATAPTRQTLPRLLTDEVRTLAAASREQGPL